MLAAAPSVSYRLHKFVRRNRALLTSVAAVLVVLIAGVVAVSILAIQKAHADADAEVARVQAEAIRVKLMTALKETEQAKQQEEVSEFLTDLFNTQIRSLYEAYRLSELRSKDITFREVLDHWWRILDEEFEGKPETEASLRKLLGTAYRSIPDYEAAERNLKAAYEIRREKLSEAKAPTLRCLNDLIEVYEAWGKPEKADEWREKLPREEQTESENQRRTNQSSAED